MPLYAYRCTQCGHRFEKIQSFSAEPVKVCPKCGGAVERPLTAPGLKFKGAGWYVNDYAPKSSSASGEAAPADAKSEPKTEAKSDAKAETKPEAKTHSKGDAGASGPSSSSSAQSSGKTAD